MIVKIERADRNEHENVIKIDIDMKERTFPENDKILYRANLIKWFDTAHLFGKTIQLPKNGRTD